MKILSGESNDWVALNGEEEAAAVQLAETRLRRIIGAERLVILSGLGTSICVKDATGETLAPTMHRLWELCKARAGSDWSHALEAASWAEDEQNIEALLTRCQMALELSKDDEALGRFVDGCEEEIASACSFVGAESDLPYHEAFLRGVARRPTRLPRTQLFTTNYDLAFETAAARTGFAVIDGFSYASPQRFDSGYFDIDFATRDRERAANALEWMPNVLQLLKLHGSVDWRSDDHGVLRDHGTSEPLLIYPRSSKFELSYRPPFLDLMSRFQAALRRADTGVLIVGSGLMDSHIAEPVFAAIRSNVRMTMMVVAPDLDTAATAPVQELKQLIARGDRRLSLLEATFEELVSLLPELAPESEAEQHKARLQS